MRRAWPNGWQQWACVGVLALVASATPASGQTVARTGTARGWAPTREVSADAQPIVEAEVEEETAAAPAPRPRSATQAKPRAGSVSREAAPELRTAAPAPQARKSPPQRGQLQNFDPWVSQTAGSRPPQRVAARSSRQVAPGENAFVENGRVIRDGDVIYEGDPSLMPESFKQRSSAPASRSTSYARSASSSQAYHGHVHTSSCKNCNGGGGGGGSYGGGYEYADDGYYEEGGDCESCGGGCSQGGCGRACGGCGRGCRRFGDCGGCGDGGCGGDGCCDRRMGMFGICRDFGCDDCGPWIDEDDCDNCRRWWRRRHCGCCDWCFWDNLSLYGGFHGFTSAPDLGLNGNFGLGYGINFGGPFWPRFGIGYQVGYRGISSNLNGELISGNVGQSRQQDFVTFGLFRRFSCDNVGYWQWGVAADFLTDNYYDSMSLGQMRVEFSHYLTENFAIGFLGAFRSQSDTGLLAGVPINWQPLNQYQLFMRTHFCNGGQALLSGGGTDSGDALFGMQATVPFNDAWALNASGLALFPTEGASTAGTINEAWNVSTNLIWYPGRSAISSSRSIYRPLFDVADNGSFLIDVVP